MAVIRRRKGVETRVGEDKPTKVGKSVKREGYGQPLGLRFEAGTLGKKRVRKRWGPRSPEKGVCSPFATKNIPAGYRFEKATEWLPKVEKVDIYEFYRRVR